MAYKEVLDAANDSYHFSDEDEFLVILEYTQCQPSYSFTITTLIFNIANSPRSNRIVLS